MNLDAEYCITEALCNTFPAALPRGFQSAPSTLPGASPALGGAQQCAVGWGMESWAGPGAVCCSLTLCSSCSNPPLDLLKHCSHSPEFSLHTQAKGRGWPQAVVALQPPWLCSGHLCSWGSGSAVTGTAPASWESSFSGSILNDTGLYNLHLPILLKVLPAFRDWAWAPASPPCPSELIGRLSSVVSRVQRALQCLESGHDQDLHADGETCRNPELPRYRCSHTTTPHDEGCQGAPLQNSYCTPAPRRPYPMLTISYSIS